MGTLFSSKFILPLEQSISEKFSLITKTVLKQIFHFSHALLPKAHLKTTTNVLNFKK